MWLHNFYTSFYLFIFIFYFVFLCTISLSLYRVMFWKYILHKIVHAPLMMYVRADRRASRQAYLYVLFCNISFGCALTIFLGFGLSERVIYRYIPASYYIDFTMRFKRWYEKFKMCINNLRNLHIIICLYFISLLPFV